MAEIDIVGLKALLVDDEETMRQLIVRFLAALGIEDVVEARDGEDALDKFSRVKSTFDIVICDIAMPRMGGIEFVTRLRAATDIPDSDVPVVMLTGHGDVEVVEAAIETGIQGYVVKPVSKATLGPRIAAAVAAKPRSR